MAQLPKGTVTFLLTDIEGSSRLWETHGTVMQDLIRRHHAILYEEIEEHGGGRPADQGEGDSVLAAFDLASGALRCAVDIQRRIGEVSTEDIELKVRIACHTGEAEFRDASNYVGPALNRTARLRGLAHGGQILISQATWDLVRTRPPEGCSFRDLGTHRLKDLTDPEQVFQVVHPDLPSDFPPPRGLDAFPTNLPTQLTSFIGREQEVQEVAKLISANRLVTLTGAAGSGKTRLAVQVAADLVDDHPAGVWFVDLAAVSDPGLVAQTAAITMGIQLSSTAMEGEDNPAGGTDPTRKLIEHVGARPVLIVLDNCEHLIAPSARLADQVLKACPSLRIIATSREPLGVAGEATYRVPSLSFPGDVHVGLPDEIADYDAIRLFIDRASLADRSFQIDATNAGAVAQIVFRLDGIPLAVELAAARVKALTPEQIATRLDDQFRLLTGGQRTALERQQTIRAAVDWSYDLLNESERILLRRLSVFSGGFTLEAAEAVCSGEGIEQENVLDFLGDLVSKSLVLRDDKVRQARYRMLETIRQYGREKLIESKEALIFRTRHRDYFLGLAEEAESGIEAEDAGRWLDVLEADIENLRAAIDWSLSEEDGAEAAQRLASALRQFWFLRGLSLEGLRFLEKTVSKKGDVSLAVKAKATSALAGYEYVARGDDEAAGQVAEEAIRLAEQAGSPEVVADSKVTLGWVAFQVGDPDKAKTYFEQSLEAGRKAGKEMLVGRSLMGLLNLAWVLGDLGRARELSEEAVRHAQSLRHPIGIARVLAAAANLEEAAGGFRKALSLYDGALFAARQIGDHPQTNRILGQMFRALVAEGEIERAGTVWREACAMAREKREAQWLYRLSSEAIRRGDLEEARSLAEEALALVREIGTSVTPLPVAFCLNNVGWCCFLSGDLENAILHLEQAERAARESGAKPLICSVLHSLGEARRMSGDDAKAAELLQEALVIARSLRSPLLIAPTLWSLAEMQRSAENHTKAADLHREALEVIGSQDNRFTIQSLESVARLIATSDPGDAARLLGASEALRETLFEPRAPISQSGYDADVAAVREALGAERFEMLTAEGKQMSLEDASAFAIKLLKAF